MIQLFTAVTTEADDADIAVQEILEQLDLPANQKAGAAGFIMCSPDFLETGVYEAICAALPFETVGCTTFTSATSGEAGTVILSVMMLTGEDGVFATACSRPLTDSLEQIPDLWRQGEAALSCRPVMVFAFAPMIDKLGGALILEALDKVSGGTPIFGTTACDPDTSTYPDSRVLYQGQAMAESVGLLFVAGNIEPQFFVTSTSEDKIQKQKAIITRSQGSVLMEVNNISAADYLRGLSLVTGDGVEGLSAIPFIVNYNDSTHPVARAIYMLTEEGYAVCGGPMPEGATLSIGSLDYEDILLTAAGTVEQALSTGKRGGLILFPCLGRNMVLGTDIYAEIDRVHQVVDGQLPYHLSYSGGEICPVYREDGSPLNRFHNFTFIACIF